LDCGLQDCGSFQSKSRNPKSKIICYLTAASGAAMNQSSYVYILALTVFGAGMWLIIEFGSTALHAREDLAGEWELTPARPADGEATVRMKIEQSGRFFRITLSNAAPMQLKMTAEEILDERLGQKKRVTLSSTNGSAIFEGLTHGDLWHCSFDGSTKGSFVGRIIERTYPRPTPAVAAKSRTANAR
jgi:hypothetical protein